LSHLSLRRLTHTGVSAALISGFAFTTPALAAGPGSGGAGIQAQEAKKAKVQNSVSNELPIAHVAPDGGSQHLGERVLHKGMKGHDVRVLQDFLTIAGYDTAIDGSFGPATLKNVVAFQSDNGERPNGVVSYSVAAAIREAVAQAEASSGPVQHATINSAGLAVPPANAPQAVVNVINAANQIATKPYIYGGGHGKWIDRGYDCSGSVSFALHGGGLLTTTEDSTQFESYGAAGAGQWITIYANAGHAYMQVAGLWFDTAAQSGSNGNNRWSTHRVSSASGFVVRHPAGL
jgi:peptidoglycan hydrolase-like protein with peptidoglycan-binding domain